MVIFNNGFEENTFTGYWTTTGSPTIITTAPHHGIYHLNGVSGDTCEKAFTGVGLIYFRVFCRWDSNPPLDGNVLTLTQILGQSFSLGRSYLVNNNGTIKWGLEYRSNLSNIDAPSNMYTDPQPNTYYCIEVMVKCSSADNVLDGEYRMWVDGNELTDIAQTGIDTDAIIAEYCKFNFYATVGYNPTVYGDCVIIDTGYIGTEAITRKAYAKGFRTL